VKKRFISLTTRVTTKGEKEIHLFDYPSHNEGEENFVLFFTSSKASVGGKEIHLFD